MTARCAIRSEIRRLVSRDRDTAALTYPGTWRFTWVRIGSVWFLVAIDQEDAGA